MHAGLRCDASTDPGLCGVVAVGDHPAAAAAWAEQLGVPVLEHRPQEGSGVILLADEPPALQLLGRRAPGPVAIDFTDHQLQRRVAGSTLRRDPLARAVGLHRRPQTAVVDATAGLGHDGWVLAALGARMTWIERSPVLAALLDAALERARANAQHADTATRVRLHPGDLCHLLPELDATSREVVYIDPMYPDGSTRGAVGRPAQVLRALHADARGPDEDQLLAAALGHATRRVVVKRPQRAAPVAGPPPSRSVAGRAVRFDVYEVNG
ncbi:class I SAM-dependent methyltransferase [Halorhodospira halophila]|uniref:Ribosomal RNA small subunit methyltransferase J n=1 Tax=Halorhodospira halophila (strain DSM 244 / SL1) TaxID=349124 RepID=RSMJ_HALHL|nr:class I SAM-dependent methyltransferase [Halorhodospira halophila]A1WYS6.1 RecName: Full=Ribosomal RNA small subunit methyltransferase J; AltName: Full=16S rRNA m2G1516 methyltransferase; AltName: Full=rRNA (guanine-N(2)-)-methyltransferase [Halorhodospira halophila SL1]ABM62838.1 protein of unknown function DUF548 [Halorhodospira halophila SL1]MBK1728039.1 hypothetical protein [Halorhodospira halophila]